MAAPLQIQLPAVAGVEATTAGALEMATGTVFGDRVERRVHAPVPPHDTVAAYAAAGARHAAVYAAYTAHVAPLLADNT